MDVYKTITAELDDSKYEIKIGRGIIDQLDEFLKQNTKY